MRSTQGIGTEYFGVSRERRYVPRITVMSCIISLLCALFCNVYRSQQIFIVRCMGIMAKCTRFSCLLVHLTFFDIESGVAMITKVSRLGHKQIGVGRAVRVVADTTTTCHYWAVHVFLFQIQDMTTLAKLLYRHDKFVATALYVAGITKIGRIGAMISIC